MKTIMKPVLGVIAGLLTLAAMPAYAQVKITEVAPWASGNAPYSADWFELTNVGTGAQNISGWKIDDSSFSFGAAASLSGVSSLAAGESVIFLETSAANFAATKASFLNAWFGSSVPANLQIGYYSGSGLGLSTSGDGVGVFNGSGVLQAKVSFGTSDAVSPYQTFDNAAGLNNATVSQYSVAGTNGAFLAANGIEVGSPGSIAAVPEPESFAMMLAGLGLLGSIARKRRHA